MDIKHCIHIYVHIQELGRKFSLLLINTLLLKKINERNTEILLTPTLYSGSSASHISKILINGVFNVLSLIHIEQRFASC